MRFVTYSHATGSGLGLQLKDGDILPLDSVLPAGVLTMQDLVAHYGTGFDQLASLAARAEEEMGEILPAKAVTLLSPFEETRHDIICVGLNYREHVDETNRAFKTDYEQPTAPVYFSKRVFNPIGHEGVVERHEGLTEKLDYEAELGVIIGKEGRDIPSEDALDHVFGYTIINDISARDLQQLHTQWYRGKSLDAFVAMGPCVVTADELPNPHDRGISCTVNGEMRQLSRTSLLIFSINELIANFSRGTTLQVGDIIASGTPSGVGMGLTPPRFLQSGDTVVCAVQGIGELAVQVE
ncbi:fumarylacetoacetate hydrolase family protein [Pseudodesulfovibrio thermohalotolerans]|uniref:fumarylacetoacetate hydrolase family protein n=1 Tax=Pseudodesulfovibrio thermohalotolerans TaxID=2880651 RepID=UPI0024414771|nr:fumarylacetoacetate hydrolase family protein [Pseudodesulfovibrio thermohalotolerans]WFS62325.1 fumarylacetoacetate hydrolase family protein [Pseudodesulfovibrio thermohalotolerans]